MIEPMNESKLAALGMPVPDSAVAKQARELITTVAPTFLTNHSVRAYAWAVELALHDELSFDSEILYVSAMLHDIGLVPAYDIGGCFETDGAIAAEAFAREHGAPPDRARAIYDVVELHMADDLPPDPAPEVMLLWDSTGTDVTGHRYADVRRAIVPDVLAAYPRLDFKREFGALFADQAARKPGCSVARMMASGKLEAINRAPYDS